MKKLSSPAGTGERQTVNIPEACAALGISKNHGYELAQRGAFPVPIIKLGRRLVVSRAALSRLLDGDSSSEEAE